MFEMLQLPFVQRGLLGIALLSVGSGLLGTWIVLRSQAFFTHAVSTATFPGLVLAAGLGFSALLGAFGVAVCTALAVAFIARKQPAAQDSATAIVLVGALALGVILVSDVFESSSSVDQLLFGSLLLVDSGDLWLAGLLSAAALAATVIFGSRWLATGFDSGAARSDVVLLVLIAVASVAVLHAMGSLLAGALLVIPAATTRLWFDRMLSWQIATVTLVLVEGVVGLMLSVELNAPPGATIAVIGGVMFACAAACRALRTTARGRMAAVVAAGAGVVLLAGCGSNDSGGKPKVVASTTIVADMTREVAGPDFDVAQILQPNSDPHDYEPRPADVRSIASADLVLSSGLGIDEFVDEAVDSSGTKARFVELGDAVPDRLESHEEADHHEQEDAHAEEGAHDHGDIDPHWWQNPENSIAAVKELTSQLKAIAPEKAQGIDARAAAYIASLRRIDRQIAGCMDQIPAKDRKLVTSHDAFGHYADRYGIQVVGAVIPSTSTQAQPNAGELAELSRTVRANNVKAIFPEEALNPLLADAIAKQTGARSDLGLYGDALGPPQSPGATYRGMLKTNTERIVEGFGGRRTSCQVDGD